MSDNFRELRESWAKILEPTEKEIESERQAWLDNENAGHRLRIEIIADLRYSFADRVLSRQYPGYAKWLEENTVKIEYQGTYKLQARKFKGE